MTSPALGGVAKRRRIRARVVPSRPVALAAVGDDRVLPARETPTLGKGSRTRGRGRASPWFWNRGQIDNYRKARAFTPHVTGHAFARYYHEIVGRTESSLRNGRANNLVVRDDTPPAREEDLAAGRLLDGLIRDEADLPDPNAIRGWLCIERLLAESKIPPTDALVDAWLSSRLAAAPAVLVGEVRKWLADRLEGEPESDSSSERSTSGFSTSSSSSEEPVSTKASSSPIEDQAIADFVDDRVGGMFRVAEGARDISEYDDGPPAPDYDSGPPAPTEDVRDRLAEVEMRVNLLERRHDEMRAISNKTRTETIAAANRASALDARLAAVTRAVNELGSRGEDDARDRMREAMRDSATDGTLYRAVAEVVGQMMAECGDRASARDRLADRD